MTFHPGCCYTFRENPVSTKDRVAIARRSRRTESGCLLKLTNGPLGFVFGFGRVQLAWVTAFGLKGWSVGPWKLYAEGAP